MHRVRRLLLTAFVIMVIGIAVNAAPQDTDKALTLLKEGNERFVSMKAERPNTSPERRVDTAVNGQKPFAVVLACSDSRVPVEELFDRGIGDIFVIRVAGNIAEDPSVIGSVEYAVEHLHCPLLVVMGHSGCGAVKAAISGPPLEGDLRFIQKSIEPVVKRVREDRPALEGDALTSEVVKANVRQAIKDIADKSKEIRHAVKEGNLQIVPAVYDLKTGAVEWLREKSHFTIEDLQKILESEWQTYKSDKPNFNGGLAIQVLSPKGDYYISTELDDDGKNNRHFRIASVTKTFTAAGIMLLNQRKLLNVDDKITDNIPGTKTPYVPDTPDYDIPYKDEITIRMLLMHRAGVFDISNNAIPDNEFSRSQGYASQNYLEYVEAQDKDHTFTFDELVGVNARNHLSFFKPGTAYHYSDTGYSMLGKIIERVSGRRYADFIEDELLYENGLFDTSLPWKGSDQALPKHFIKGYVWKDGEIEEVTRSNMSPHVAEGNIISTPINLATWCRKLLSGEAGLTKETVAMMKAGMKRDDAPDSTYGLGILHSDELGYGHAGAHEGYLTLMYYDPKLDIYYAMFTNIWNCQNGLESIKDELKFMTAVAHKILKKMAE